MEPQTVTFTNELGEALAPFLLALRSAGIFEAYVYMPMMTILSIAIFVVLLRPLGTGGIFDALYGRRAKYLMLISYYLLCFVATACIAVALKSLIFEELDYGEFYWFVPYVSPLHFYITSVAAAYLWLVRRNRAYVIDRALAIYIQIGLLGGYVIGVYRVLNEPFEIPDTTTGFGGLLSLLWFVFLNIDIALRLAQPLSAPARARALPGP